MAGNDALRLKPLFSGVACYRRLLFWISFYAAVLAAWLVLFQMSLAMSWQAMPRGTPADFWTSLCIGAADVNPMALYGMWVLMTVAMMPPTFVPALRVFGEIADVKASDIGSMAARVGVSLLYAPAHRCRFHSSGRSRS